MGKFMRSIAITSCVVTGVWGLLTLTVGESLDNDPYDSLSLSTTNTLPPWMQAVTLTWSGKYGKHAHMILMQPSGTLLEI